MSSYHLKHNVFNIDKQGLFYPFNFRFAYHFCKLFCLIDPKSGQIIQVMIKVIVKIILTINWRMPIKVGFTFTAGLSVP